MIADYKGGFLNYVKDSPFGYRIECIRASSSGLVVAGQNNYLWSFELKDQKEQRPSEIPIYYTLLHSKIGTDEKSDIGKDANTSQDGISSIALSFSEDHIYAVDRQN